MKLHFPGPILNRLRPRKRWSEIDGWFQWREAQEEAAKFFPDASRFVEVGTYLGRSLCSLAEVVQLSGKQISVIGIDTCRGSGPEGWRNRDYHADAVQQGGGTFAGLLHKNIMDCGFAELITLIISDSVKASSLFPDGSIDWLHLDGRHDYESVCAAIRAWLPKLRAAAWMSGDDYDDVKWPSVGRAGSDLLPDAHIWGNQQWRWISKSR